MNIYPGAFIGDDVFDLPALELAGVSATVADAHPRVLEMAQVVTQAAGGQGAEPAGDEPESKTEGPGA